jgi:hypothetical protein
MITWDMAGAGFAAATCRQHQRSQRRRIAADFIERQQPGG